MSAFDYDQSPAGNNSAPPDGAPEDMAPSGVNNTMRQMMANIAGMTDLYTAGGTANALTVTLSPAAFALSDKMVIWVLPSAANTGATTLNVDSLGAKKVFVTDGTELSGGELDTTRPALLRYDSSANGGVGAWIILESPIRADLASTASGKGADLVTNSARRVSTIAAMTALTKPTVDKVAVVEHYATEGDGGGGIFRWDDGATDTADGGLVFAADSGGNGRWKRIHDPSYINILWYGTTAITSALQSAADALPSTGGTIDARGVTGTKTLTGQIFNLARKPITFLGGNTTYQWDISSFMHQIHAGTVIRGQGTVFQPDAVGSSAVNSTNNGMFTTIVDTTTGSVTAAGRAITVSSASNINEGDMIAIEAAAGGTTNQETALSAGIDASVTTIPVNSTSAFPSSGVILIDSELISYTGKDATNFTGATRGALGTTAASHLSAATVQHTTWLRGVVDSVSGTTVTIRDEDDAATLAVSGAQVFIGQQGVRFEGALTIDGRQDRSGADASPSVLGIKGRFASRLHVDESVILKSIDQGGVYLESSYKNTVYGRYKEIGRPADALGSDIWVFQNSRENIIKPVESHDGYTQVTIDDRTTNAGALDGKSNDNVVELCPPMGYQRSLVISGSDNNHADIPYASTADDTVTVSETQGSTARTATGNTIRAGHLISSGGNYANIAGSGNQLDAQKVSGAKTISTTSCLRVQPDRRFVKNVSIDYGAIASDGRANSDQTVTGAQVGDTVDLRLRSSLSGGSEKGLMFRAWVQSANTVRVEATNTDGAAAHDPGSIDFTIIVEGGLETLG